MNVSANSTRWLIVVMTFFRIGDELCETASVSVQEKRDTDYYCTTSLACYGM